MKELCFDKLQVLYRGQDDFRLREIDCGIPLKVVCLDSMCDDVKVATFVLQPLAYISDASSINDIETKLSVGNGVRKPPNFYAIVEDFTNGYTLVFDDKDNCISVDTRTVIGRSIAEPPTSMVMRGPREGFVEDMKVNLTLLRKRLKTPNLKIINLNVGKYTNTAVAVCYIEGISQQRIVDDVVQRLQSVNVDGVLDSSYLARYLDGNKTVLFRRVGTTEKPDIAVGKMLEGRIAIIVDGSPMVLTIPYLFVEDMQSPGDYYENSSMTTLSRVLRFISVIASVLLPTMYVCLQVYNYQIIPLRFLITILNASESIPFSPLSEMIIVLVIFDILREANLRMPSAVGISLSLVGAIVLGDAAVQAGLLGAPAVMIGALSGIGLYTLPDNTLILSLLRLIVTLLGGLMGLLGVIISTLVLIIYLASMQDYKTPFLAPFTPDIPADRQDAVAQIPVPKMKKRPRSIPNVNDERRG
ncbi:MAG: spore germination protein [Clostridiales bacterium]|nr:spore germination protein [Clostridiales bacterium]